MSKTEGSATLLGPRWIQVLLRWCGGATIIILGITGLLSAIGELANALEPSCRAVASLPWCPVSAHNMQAVIVPPQLASYDSPEVDGGHGQAEYCEPRRISYQSQHPKFEIKWIGSETNTKDWRGHVTYRYHCEFSATPRADAK